MGIFTNKIFYRDDGKGFLEGNFIARRNEDFPLRRTNSQGVSREWTNRPSPPQPSGKICPPPITYRGSNDGLDFSKQKMQQATHDPPYWPSASPACPSVSCKWGREAFSHCVSLSYWQYQSTLLPQIARLLPCHNVDHNYQSSVKCSYHKGLAFLAMRSLR